MWTSRHKLIARNLAATLVAGVLTPVAVARRFRTVLGHATLRPQKRLVAEIVAKADKSYPPSIGALAKIILDAPSFERAASSVLRSDAPLKMVLRAPRFAPIPELAAAEIPNLPTEGDIARWLGLPLEQLDWFTDARRQHGRTAIPDLQHYTYTFRTKSVGLPRLIEAPKPRLKTMQSRILHGILDHVPAHQAAHGFVAGRSVLTGAELHTNAAVVVGLDLKDFFLTTPLGRVHALFRSLGFPHNVARMLTRLSSTVTPDSIFDRLPPSPRHTRAAMRAYSEPHLPQGAPTSPALANLVAWRMDVRLAGLARSFDATYSRYADDLTFSGEDAFAAKTHSLVAAVREIVIDEGYTVNDRKTRIMSRASRQRVTGVVVNRHLNVSRDGYDALKAILHNCRRNGIDAENRSGHANFRAHLEGRVGWVESLNPARGRKLRAMLEAIA